MGDVDDACGGAVTCAPTFKTVEVAIQAYQAKEGHLPSDSEALVDAGFLREIPSEVNVVDGVYTMAPDADCF